MSIKFRNANDDLEEEYSELTGIAFDPSDDKAVQSGKDDADINVILKRFGVTGQLPVPNMEPFYGDFSQEVDYQTALNRVLEADTAFSRLPSEVRNRFSNDPLELIRFLDNEDNLEEARRMGLLRPEEPAPAPMRVVVDNFPDPAAPSS